MRRHAVGGAGARVPGSGLHRQGRRHDQPGRGRLCPRGDRADPGRRRAGAADRTRHPGRTPERHQGHRIRAAQRARARDRFRVATRGVGRLGGNVHHSGRPCGRHGPRYEHRSRPPGLSGPGTDSAAPEPRGGTTRTTTSASRATTSTRRPKTSPPRSSSPLPKSAAGTSSGPSRRCGTLSRSSTARRWRTTSWT